jgi:hypothetical protein
MEHTAPSGPAKWDPSSSTSGATSVAIVRAPASLDGSEVEIRRCGTPWDGAHAAVRARHIPDGVIHAALFDGLGHGNYEVRCRATRRDPLPLLAWWAAG